MYDLRPRLDRVPNVERYVSEGDPVEVLNRDGRSVNATFVEILPCQVQEYPVPWSDKHDDLYDLWVDPAVDPDEKVVEVEIGGETYAYPISRVRMGDLETVTGVGETTAEKLYENGIENRVDLAETDEELLRCIDGLGQNKVAGIKDDVGDVEPTPDPTCPVDGCMARPDEEELYDHMIGEHGWYSDDLEVKKAK
jgi:hypothetical protein